MKTNEGTLDRGRRIVVGLALIGMAATGTVGLTGYTGVPPLLTDAVGNCALYTLHGINICRTRR